MSEIKRRPNTPLWREIDALRHQTVGQLRVKYLEVFRQESRSNNQKFLVRRIAWRMQANAEGGLSERARQRAVLVAEEADLRIRAPQFFLKSWRKGTEIPHRAREETHRAGKAIASEPTQHLLCAMREKDNPQRQS
jgi:hypothetical protein